MKSLIKKILYESLNLFNDKISASELQKIQCAGSKPSCDIIFGINDTDSFILTQIKIKDIQAPKGLDFNFYKRKKLDEDISIVKRIINALSNNELITPFVIDENDKIMDGLHRFVAFKYYYGGEKIINVYKRITNINENLNNNLKSVYINKFIYHKSNPKFRNNIEKNGLIPKGKSETWLSNTPISGKVIFATNSNDKKDWFDSTYDDDIYQIDTSKINNEWFEDPNFSSDKEEWVNYNGKKIKLPKDKIENKHVITFQPIPTNALKLIYNGSGKSEF